MVLTASHTPPLSPLCSVALHRTPSLVPFSPLVCFISEKNPQQILIKYLLCCPSDMNYPIWIKHDLTKKACPQYQAAKTRVPSSPSDLPTICWPLWTAQAHSLSHYGIKKHTLHCSGYFSPPLGPSLCISHGVSLTLLTSQSSLKLMA